MLVPMRRRTWRVTAAAALVFASLGVASATAVTSGVGRSSEQAVRVAPQPRRATFAFTGDILTHRPVNYAAQQSNGSYDYGPMFERIAPLVGWADVAICHLEVPIAPPGQPVIVGPVIHSAAPSIAPALRNAGYDRCSTASNHAYDRGIAGIDATVAGLTDAGIAQSGMARTPAEAVPQLFDVNGITVAHLSYSYAVGFGASPDEPWRANKIDPDAIVAAARDARLRGADAVIVSLHWGSSAQQAPSSYQRQVAAAVTATGDIDLIVGHHAHVLQPIEQVNGTWVVWGLGNLISNLPVSFWPPSTQDGAIVTAAIVRDGAGQISVEPPLVYPTWCDKDHGYVIRPTSDADDPALSSWVRHQLGVSEARTRSVIGSFFGPD